MASGLDSLVESLLDGERDSSRGIAAALVSGGSRPLDIITGGVERAMAALDRKCTPFDAVGYLDSMAGRGDERR